MGCILAFSVEASYCFPSRDLAKSAISSTRSANLHNLTWHHDRLKMAVAMLLYYDTQI